MTTHAALLEGIYRQFRVSFQSEFVTHKHNSRAAGRKCKAYNHGRNVFCVFEHPKFPEKID